MSLAAACGLDVAGVEVREVLGRQVLMVERFDRTTTPGQRRLMISALTLLHLDEHTGRYATYPDLAEAIRAHFDDPDANAARTVPGRRSGVQHLHLQHRRPCSQPRRILGMDAATR